MSSIQGSVVEPFVVHVVGLSACFLFNFYPGRKFPEYLYHS